MGSQEQDEPLPIIIIGAGISGLLLAQYLHKNNTPFRIFERDADFTTRGVGWGLTLHWSLPALRELLPDDLVARLPETYVDRAAVERGEASVFPFFDLSTGELKGASPRVPESLRIRVTRERLRRLVATDIDVQWGKGIVSYEEGEDAVTAVFEDGSRCRGSLLIACDGGASNVRSQLFPNAERYRIPVNVLGLKVSLTPDEIEPIRSLDPFFLQGTSSRDNSYIYLSMLDAPRNRDIDSDSRGKYSCQICVSWRDRPQTSSEVTTTDRGRLDLIRFFAKGWSEPFQSLMFGIPDDTEIKPLKLFDYPPPKGIQTSGRVLLMGDSFHEMAMYRGEGANHAILDVLDFAHKVVPKVVAPFPELRAAMDEYEIAVVSRARPGVLASRRACLDAHEWPRIGPTSPLLSKREMFLQYDEEEHTDVL